MLRLTIRRLKSYLNNQNTVTQPTNKMKIKVTLPVVKVTLPVGMVLEGTKVYKPTGTFLYTVKDKLDVFNESGQKLPPTFPACGKFLIGETLSVNLVPNDYKVCVDLDADGLRALADRLEDYE